MEKTSVYKRLLSNTAVFSAGKFISKLLVFFMVRLYTGYMTPEEFGTADLITNMANLIIPLACLGISEGIFRSAAAKTGDKEAFFTTGLCVLGVGSAFFIALSPLLTLIPAFRTTAWLILLYVLASNLHTVVSQYLCAIGRTKLFAVQGIVNTLLVIGLNVLFLPVLRLGVTGYVLSILLADFLTTLFLIFFARVWRSVKRVPRDELRRTAKSMLAFCLPLIPALVFGWITGVSDRYMVAWLRSDAENGIYTAAYKIPTLLIHAVTIFDSAWKLSASGEDADPETCRRVFTKVWRVYTTVAFLGGAALILSGKLFCAILLAPEFRGAWIYIPLLTYATVFTALDTFLSSVYFVSKRTVWSMVTALCGALINIGLNLLLIPRWGAVGASLATLVSYLLVFILRMITVRNLIRFEREVGRNALNTLLLGGVCGFAMMTELEPASALLPPAAWWAAAALCAAVMAVFNAKAVWGVAKSILKRG